MSQSTKGEKLVALPDGVTVLVDGAKVRMEGPKGTVEREVTGAKVRLEGTQVIVGVADGDAGGADRQRDCWLALTTMANSVAQAQSRIGKAPIPTPAGASVKVDDDLVRVKGPKGTLERRVPGVNIVVEPTQVRVRALDDSARSRSMHGLSRTLIANMVQGVTTGFARNLEINGVGYRADVKDNVLTMSLGYSHPVVFPMPQGITVSVEKQTKLRLEGIDKELLGQTAAKVRAFRPPEPYKGKGIKYAEETIVRKVGKSA